MHRNRRPLAGSVALIAVWQVCEVFVPVLIGVVIDAAVATGDVSRALLWGAVLCVHFGVLSTSYRLGSRIGFRATQTEGHRLRTEVSAHVLDDRGARTEQPPGDLLSVATADADMASGVLQQVTYAVAAVLGLVVTAVVLASIDPVLAVVVLVGVPLVLACTQLLAPALARRSEVRQAASGRAIGVATDLVQGLRPLKGISAEGTALARYQRQSREAAGAAVSAARWEGVLYGVTAGLSGIFLAVVALLAGTRALDGELGVGELIAVVGLAQFIAEPMRTLAYLVAQVAKSKASAGRIVAVLASPHLVVFGDQPDADGPLELQEVHHGPLQALSLVARPGEIVGVVAEDPADAVAMMTLLRGEAVPERGSVCLGGQRLTDLDATAVRRRLLVADHHVDLFEGTLGSNVDPLGRLDPEQLREVLTASAADDVVDHAPLGLAEPVAVGGTTLSGGQRQRLGLARALAGDADVLVLHDPTTAVDAVTELRIGQALRAVRAGRTTVVLTSSPALLSQADRVLHVRGGRVVATGTHPELVHQQAYRQAVLR